jgi:transposase
VKGKRWLLLSRWENLEGEKQLWCYRHEGAMLNYPQRWIEQLRRQRLAPFEKLAKMILDHLDVILSYCRVQPSMGIVEAINRQHQNPDPSR